VPRPHDEYIVAQARRGSHSHQAGPVAERLASVDAVPVGRDLFRDERLVALGIFGQLTFRRVNPAGVMVESSEVEEEDD
jgi:hypothetical protein